jgi:hypothetical protein
VRSLVDIPLRKKRGDRLFLLPSSAQTCCRGLSLDPIWRSLPYPSLASPSIRLRDYLRNTLACVPDAALSNSAIVRARARSSPANESATS